MTKESAQAYLNHHFGACTTAEQALYELVLDLQNRLDRVELREQQALGAKPRSTQEKLVQPKEEGLK
jgi:hypothetical protein